MKIASDGDAVVEDYGVEYIGFGWHLVHIRIISKSLILVIILLQLVHDGNRINRVWQRKHKPHIMPAWKDVSLSATYEKIISGIKLKI